MIERDLDMDLKSKRRMKINNLPGIQTSTEIDAPLSDDSSESESDIDEIAELSIFEAELELYQARKRGNLLLLFETLNMG